MIIEMRLPIRSNRIIVLLVDTVPGEKNGGRNTTSIFGRNVTVIPIRTIVYITELGNGILI